MASEIAAAAAAHLPRLRRYARALTGGQESGDALAARMLEALLADPGPWEAPLPPGPHREADRLRLLRALHAAWVAQGAPLGLPDSPASASAQGHLAELSPQARAALLLHAVESLTAPAIGAVIGAAPERAEALVEEAIQAVEAAMAGRVLIVEDEAAVAEDLAAIVREMGHRVTGIARTRAEALRLGVRERPDLVLADVELADGSSGLDVAAELARRFEGLACVFVTAHPERLLASGAHDPAFLVAKPYGEEEVRSAVSQALFLQGPESLAA
jgi:CheY-like chemotaxis protein